VPGSGADGAGALVALGICAGRSTREKVAPGDTGHGGGSCASGRYVGRQRLWPVACARGPASARVECGATLGAGAPWLVDRLSSTGWSALGMAPQPGRRTVRTVPIRRPSRSCSFQLSGGAFI
jgi:hypothetical protein